MAVVGCGPAGLTAAHYLSLRGYRVTAFDTEPEPGGMLFSAIPAYRLPHDVVRKEIASILDENVTVKCDTMLGRDITLDGLFSRGYGAVFLALGAHKSLRLGLPGEESAGVLPSIQFLKAWNLRGESLARGRVVVVGGGNSAIDAARVAMRQEGVEKVTLLYRRTREEMPAFEEEVEAAVQEGIALVTLTSPVRILVAGRRSSGSSASRTRSASATPAEGHAPSRSPGASSRSRWRLSSSRSPRAPIPTAWPLRARSILWQGNSPLWEIPSQSSLKPAAVTCSIGKTNSNP